MPKKNQSKSDEKDLSRNQKKPLPEPDPNLIQEMYKRKNKDKRKEMIKNK